MPVVSAGLDGAGKKACCSSEANKSSSGLTHPAKANSGTQTISMKNKSRSHPGSSALCQEIMIGGGGVRRELPDNGDVRMPT
jgi:hypothetical protein